MWYIFTTFCYSSKAINLKNRFEKWLVMHIPKIKMVKMHTNKAWEEHLYSLLRIIQSVYVHVTVFERSQVIKKHLTKKAAIFN